MADVIWLVVARAGEAVERVSLALLRLLVHTFLPLYLGPLFLKCEIKIESLSATKRRFIDSFARHDVDHQRGLDLDTSVRTEPMLTRNDRRWRGQVAEPRGSIRRSAAGPLHGRYFELTLFVRIWGDSEDRAGTDYVRLAALNRLEHAAAYGGARGGDESSMAFPALDDGVLRIDL